MQLYVVSRSGASVQRITHDRLTHQDPVWSADGELIADNVGVAGGDRVQVMTKRGDRVRRLHAGSVSSGLVSPSWSPKGRRLAFTRVYRAGEAIRGRLVTVSLADGKRRVLADRAVGKPGWAPDGKSLLYLRGDIVPPGDSGMPEDQNRFELWTVNANGSGERRVAASVSGGGQYSPDGARFLFFRGPTPNYTHQLWTARADGSGQRRLTRARFAPYARWAPGGRGIWLTGDYLNDHGSMLFGPDGERRPFPTGIRDPADWSADRKLIAWTDRSRVRTIRPGGTGKRTLFRFRTNQGDGECYHLEWRPDGREFLVACREDLSD